MSTVVGIFDDAQKMERAVEQFAAAGLDNTVYDESTTVVDEGELRPVLPPAGKPRAGVAGDVAGLAPQPGRSAEPRRQTFEDELGRFNLSDEVAETYGRMFLRGGKFVFVKAEGDQASQAVEILRNCGATSVDRYD